MKIGFFQFEGIFPGIDGKFPRKFFWNLWFWLIFFVCWWSNKCQNELNQKTKQKNWLKIIRIIQSWQTHRKKICSIKIHFNWNNWKVKRILFIFFGVGNQELQKIKKIRMTCHTHATRTYSVCSCRLKWINEFFDTKKVKSVRWWSVIEMKSSVPPHHTSSLHKDHHRKILLWFWFEFFSIDNSFNRIYGFESLKNTVIQSLSIIIIIIIVWPTRKFSDKNSVVFPVCHSTFASFSNQLGIRWRWSMMRLMKLMKQPNEENFQMKIGKHGGGQNP